MPSARLPSPTPPPSMDALGAHLRLFGETLAEGEAAQWRRREAGAITAHAWMAHRTLVLDAHTIMMGLWGSRGPITAHQAMASLTPTIHLGLAAPGVAARLRDRGILAPHQVWAAPFQALNIPIDP